MGNELFDIVNPTYLHSLHDIFSDKVRCTATILDEHCQPITPESRHCAYCYEIRKTNSGLRICRDSDRKGMELARTRFEVMQRPEPVFYKCNHGLIDFCAPIVVGDEIMGYLMGGQFRHAASRPKTNDQHGTEHDNKIAGKSSPEDIFRIPATDSPELDTLLAEIEQNNKHATEQNREFVDKDKLCQLFEQTHNFDSQQFKFFYDEFKNLTDLLNAFIAKVRGLHKPEKAYSFMKGVIGIKNVEELYELMVNELPLLFDAVGASIFVVHHDHERGDRLVLQKTSFTSLKAEEKTAYYERGQGLTGWVWANKRCLRIKNLKNPGELKSYPDLKWKGVHNDSNNHSSFLAVPMFEHTGEVLGVLRLPHKMGDIAFTSEDEIFLRFLADHLSKVIECQTAKDVVQQTTGRSGLANAASELFAARSQEEILEAGLNSSAMLFDTAGKMHFINVILPGGIEWKIVNARGTLDFTGTWKDRHFSIHEGLTGKVLRTFMNTKSNNGDIKYDLKEAFRKGEYIDIVSNARSAMAAPIFWGEDIYGAIAVASDKQYEFTREKDLRILESLSVLIGIALHNETQRRSKIVKIFESLFRFGCFLWSIFVRTKPRSIDGEN